MRIQRQKCKWLVLNDVMRDGNKGVQTRRTDWWTHVPVRGNIQVDEKKQTLEKQVKPWLPTTAGIWGESATTIMSIHFKLCPFFTKIILNTRTETVQNSMFLTLMKKLLFSSDSISCCVPVCRAHSRCCVSTVRDITAGLCACPRDRVYHKTLKEIYDLTV